MNIKTAFELGQICRELDLMARNGIPDDYKERLKTIADRLSDMVDEEESPKISSQTITVPAHNDNWYKITPTWNEVTCAEERRE